MNNGSLLRVPRHTKARKARSKTCSIALASVWLILSTPASAQTAWFPVAEVDGVQFEYRSIQRCEGNYTQWRVTNTTDQTVDAFLRERIYRCGEGEDRRGAFAAFYALEPGQVREGLREDFVCPDVVVGADLIADVEVTDDSEPGA